MKLCSPIDSDADLPYAHRNSFKDKTILGNYGVG